MSVDLCAKRRYWWSERPDDLAMPRPPEPPYFNHVRGEWVLSRYVDVLAALHDSRFQPTKDKRENRTQTDEQIQSSIRSEIRRSLPPSQLSEWQLIIEPLAQSWAAALPNDGTVDLVGDFAEPWCAEVAMIITGAAAEYRERLIELARRISATTADPDDPELKTAAGGAESELQELMPSGAIPMAGAAFVALAQTLPGFLAMAWLALLRHRRELSRLRANPELMPAAVEELLRYAGLARSITRFTRGSVDLGGVAIPAGEKIKLALNSANRDPVQFPEPNRLDLTGRTVRHLALGAGPHSCVGGGLIRMVSTAATKVFVQRLHAASVCESVRWRGGSVFRAPAVLSVCFRWSSRTASEQSSQNSSVTGAAHKII